MGCVNMNTFWWMSVSFTFIIENMFALRDVILDLKRSSKIQFFFSIAGLKLVGKTDCNSRTELGDHLNLGPLRHSKCT